MAVRCDEHSVPFIGILSALRSPATIIFTVMPVILNPIQRQACWLLAHVPQEIPEIDAPLLADLNSARAIVSISGIFWVLTSLLHGNPNPIRPAQVLVVLRVSLDATLFLQAPTGKCRSLHECFTGNNLLRAAITLAMPIRTGTASGQRYDVNALKLTAC